METLWSSCTGKEDLLYNFDHMNNVTIEGAKKPKFVRWAVMLGIVIVLNLFFLVARSLVLPEPQYQDYCLAAMATTTPQTQDACVTAGGAWQPDLTAKDTTTGYCDVTAKCQGDYQKDFDQYQLYSFIVEVGLGVLALLVGIIPLGSSIVSTGLSYGGVVSFIIAGAQYWGDANSWLRLAMSIIALGTLIYIGFKRFHD